MCACVRTTESNRRGMNRQRSPVAPPQFLQSLKLTAIDQQTRRIDLEQVLRSGDGAGRAEKRQSSHDDNEPPLSAKTEPQRRAASAPATIATTDCAQSARARSVISGRPRAAASQSDRL